jgi:hypothetical protein
LTTDSGEEVYDDAVEKVVLPDEVHHTEQQDLKEGERHLVAIEQHLVKRVAIVCNNTQNGNESFHTKQISTGVLITTHPLAKTE